MDLASEETEGGVTLPEAVLPLFGNPSATAATDLRMCCWCGKDAPGVARAAAAAVGNGIPDAWQR